MPNQPGPSRLRMPVLIALLLVTAGVGAWFWARPDQDPAVSNPDLQQPIIIQPDAHPAEQIATIQQRAQQRARDELNKLAAQLETIVSQFAAADAPKHERADLLLRNLPLPAFPLVQAYYEKNSATMDPETSLRFRRSLEMFQGLSRLEKRRQEQAAWITTAALAAYQSSGEQSPRWDDAARELIALLFDPTEDDVRTGRLRELSATLQEAGCKDALVQYGRAWVESGRPGADKFQVMALAKQAADAVSASEYPHFIKCLVLARSAGLIDSLEVANERGMRTMLPYQLARDNFCRITPEEATPPAMLYQLAMLSYPRGAEGWDYFLNDYKRLYAHLEKLAPASPYLDLFKGVVHRDRALDNPPWAQRNTKPYASPEARRAALLDIARKALEAAAAAMPEDPRPAAEMMKALAWSGADVAEVEKWFRRALAASPDNAEVCRAWINILPPERRLEFGRELLRRQNWRAELPFLLIELHAALAERAEERHQYWEQPEVWQDVRSVYEAFLQLYPESARARSNFARLATLCARWNEADEQFRALGDHPDLEVFGGQATFNYLKRKTAKRLAQGPVQPPRTPAGDPRL